MKISSFLRLSVQILDVTQRREQSTAIKAYEYGLQFDVSS